MAADAVAAVEKAAEKIIDYSNVEQVIVLTTEH